MGWLTGLKNGLLFLKAKAAAGPMDLGGGYDAARSGRRLASWRADDASINTLLASGGSLLRARARKMCRENPYAANACEAFTAAAVGAGIKPSSLIEDRDTKKAVQAAFLRWTDEADADGLTDFYGLQALAARASFEAGEVFVRLRARRPEDGLSVPFQLQLIESEMLPLEHNGTAANGDRIVCGIQFDAIGRRRFYHFLKRHPGEINVGLDSLERVVVPASEVIHLYRPLRPGQVRGQPGITPGMVRLYLLDSYDDAELERKRTAALYAGFITKSSEPRDVPPPLAASALPGVASGDPAAVLLPLEPGALQELADGESVVFSEPADVGGSYEAFQFRTLLAIASAVGLPYHAVTGDVSKANYSSLRASQVEFRRRMDQFQHMTLVYQLCRPVWDRWFETAVLAGAIPVTPAALARDPSLKAAKWIPPRWEWVDPKKDREAQALAEDRGWMARSDSIEAEGYDPEEVDGRIAADRARERELGLDFGLKPQAAPPTAAASQDAEDRPPAA